MYLIELRLTTHDIRIYQLNAISLNFDYSAALLRVFFLINQFCGKQWPQSALPRKRCSVRQPLWRRTGGRKLLPLPVQLYMEQ